MAPINEGPAANMSANAIEAGGAVTVSPVERDVAVVPGEKDAVTLTLDNLGMIRDCSGPSEAVFKYRRDELIERHVSLLLPELEGLELVRNGEPNHRLHFQCRIGQLFAAVTRDGVRFASKLFFSLLDNTGDGRLSLIVRPANPSQPGGVFA
jgi:hypothetical protein